MHSRKIAFVAALLLGCLMSARADVSGKWKAEFDTQVGLQKYTFDFKADGDKLTGKLKAEREGAPVRESEIKDGKIDKDQITFSETLKIQDQEIKIEFTGKVSADEIKFTRKVGDFGSTEATAKRAKDEKKDEEKPKDAK